ncbi:MAG: hypothetical protein ABID61_05890 [Candidatus Micrarchaeota archaeon]
MSSQSVVNEITGIGISQSDAVVLADCFISGKSCSWVNTDDVSHDSVRKLLDYMEKNNHKFALSIKTIPTRGKYIWEVKLRQ